jgi:hypothetical protein
MWKNEYFGILFFTYYLMFFDEKQVFLPRFLMIFIHFSSIFIILCRLVKTFHRMEWNVDFSLG